MEFLRSLEELMLMNKHVWRDKATSVYQVFKKELWLGRGGHRPWQGFGEICQLSYYNSVQKLGPSSEETPKSYFPAGPCEVWGSQTYSEEGFSDQAPRCKLDSLDSLWALPGEGSSPARREALKGLPIQYLGRGLTWNISLWLLKVQTERLSEEQAKTLSLQCTPQPNTRQRSPLPTAKVKENLRGQLHLYQPPSLNPSNLNPSPQPFSRFPLSHTYFLPFAHKIPHTKSI